MGGGQPMMNGFSPMAMSPQTQGGNASGMGGAMSLGAAGGSSATGGGPMPPGSIPFASMMLPNQGIPQNAMPQFSPQAQLQMPPPSPQGGSMFQVNGQTIGIPPGGSATIQSGGMTITLNTSANNAPASMPTPGAMNMPSPNGMPVGHGMPPQGQSPFQPPTPMMAPPMAQPPQIQAAEAQRQQLQQAQQQQALMGLVLQSLIQARTGLAQTPQRDAQQVSRTMESIIQMLANQRLADQPPRATGTPNIAARGLPLPRSPQGDGRTPLAATATGGDPLSPLKSFRNNAFGIPVGYDNIGPQIGALPASITAFMQMLQNTSMLGRPNSYQTV